MRLVTALEISEMDQLAIQEYGIPGLVLMENAGLGVTRVIREIIGQPEQKNIAIFAGKGNNGGDGFVVARHLFNAGAKVQVFLAAKPEQVKGDALVNLEIWRKMGQKIRPLASKNDINLVRLTLKNTDLVVDALYGTGFRGTVPERLAKVIDIINASGKPVVAVDIPSGLEADTGRANGSCIRAHHTVTMALAKIGLVLPGALPFTGRLHVVDISMPAVITSGGLARYFYLTRELVRDWWPRRTGPEHKGSFGRVLVLAGSRGLSGAAVLAAQAAARTGAGLVTLGVPEGIHQIAESKLTEVMTFPLPETERGTLGRAALDGILERLPGFDVLVLGPGLGRHGETDFLVKELILRAELPCVLDADGLNAIVGKNELFKIYKNELVLTPHPGELARLVGCDTSQINDQRLLMAEQKAREWQCTLVLKGQGTVVAGNQGTLYLNGTGNPGLASGGTGDVLTGIIAGLLAQGLPALKAAAAGVYLHGWTGDEVARDKGVTGLLATDLLEKIPFLMKELE